MNIEKKVSLKDKNTFKTGGMASYFAEINKPEDLIEAIEFSKNQKIPFFVIGGGSNVLISEKGVDGLVLRINISGLEFSENEGVAYISAGAGVSWDDLVAFSVEKGLYGLENLSGIPGTVGGAPVQNIGAYGDEVKNSVSSVVVFDTENLSAKVIENVDCEFGYRDSIFKKPEGKKYIITKVNFVLSKKGELKSSYKDIVSYFENNTHTELTLENIRKAVLEIRSKKFPDLSKFGTAGSFFKNPIVSIEDFNLLMKKYPDLPSFYFSEKEVKIPAGYLIDKICNLKGFRKGNVGTYENQALVVVNYGEATSDEIVEFTNYISKNVLEKTGIRLEREVVSVF